jgi:hypothetical protein
LATKSTWNGKKNTGFALRLRDRSTAAALADQLMQLSGILQNQTVCQIAHMDGCSENAKSAV